MMDRLKDFIDKNREAFEASPTTGHESRFMRRLQPHRRRNRMLVWGGVAAAAAVVLLLLFQTTLFFGGNGEQDLLACEFEEVRTYYQMEIVEVAERITEVTEQSGDAEEIQTVLQDVSEALESTEAFEKQEVPNIPRTEQGLYAITQYYQNSLSGLNRMLASIENIK